MFRLCYFATFFLISFQNECALAQRKIDPDLLKILEKGEKANVMVHFSNGVNSAILKAKVARSSDRGSRLTSFRTELVENAENSQVGVINMLSNARSSGQGYQYFTKFWISNQLFIKQADLQTVQQIAQDPQVVRIEQEAVYILPDISRDNPETRKIDQTEEPIKHWNLPIIKIPEAWALLGGNKGEGVVVAVIDSGVDGEHTLLKNNFRGEYGWLDPVSNSPTPVDNPGYKIKHGTPCMSMMAGGSFGGNPIGVAPGAKWMACRGCNDSKCPEEFVTACYQFMACPTLTDGSKPDCSKAPQVLSISLLDWKPGGYLSVIETLKEMGVIILAAAGNSGPHCKSTKWPSNSDSTISFGSTTSKDEVITSSSRGPRENDGKIQPDLVAPGHNVMAADAKDPNGIWKVSGTSFATPTAAGVVALLHVRDPDISFETVKQLLIDTAERNIGLGLYVWQCDTNATDIPNNHFGWGRINALKVLEAQSKLLETKSGK